MKLLGLKDKDEQKLKQGLADINELYRSLSAKYSLRNDLTELTDRRYALNALFREEMEKLEGQRNDLIRRIDESKNLQAELEQSLEAIHRIGEALKKDEDGFSLYDRVSALVDEKSIASLEKKAEAILAWHKDILVGTSEDPSLAETVEYEAGEISKQYNKLFIELGEKGKSMIDGLSQCIEEISNKYDDLFLDVDGDSKVERIENKLAKIDGFYDKIYGNENKKIRSLQSDLDARMEALRQVEGKAKSVINLSSEAGLAGGFVVKGNEAKRGRSLSAGVFCFVVFCIFSVNLVMFDISDFKSISWDALIFKVMVNAPLIWVATIANINLNRFSRLEQEYSHKEALAKSYERYKDEIEQLEQIGIEGANDLKIKLLEINLDAFKVNPAANSDRAKSDAPFNGFLKKSKDAMSDGSRRI